MTPGKTQDTPLGILPEAPEEVRVSIRKLDGWISVKIQHILKVNATNAILFNALIKPGTHVHFEL